MLAGLSCMSFHSSKLGAVPSVARHVQTNSASPSEAEERRSHRKTTCGLRHTVHYHNLPHVRKMACVYDRVLVLNIKRFIAPSVCVREKERAT